MPGFTSDSLKAAIAGIAARMEDAAEELNDADARLGDGDLGITMTRGLRGAMEIRDDLPDDVGMALLKCAQAFTKVSGSSYGTLLATGLMSAAKACKGRTQVRWAEIPDLLAGAVTAMMARGKGSLGDKTVLDSLDAIRREAEGLGEPAALLAAAEAGARGALETFRDRPSRIGRARMFGDKSVGLDDPGMLALRRVIEGLVA